jgi:sugar O-acyltransferase (sialic acid O-acetyltransferase NeuD family)
MKRIVVAGASGLGKGVIDIIEQRGEYTIAGLIDERRSIGEQFFGYPVLGRDEDLPSLVAAHSIDAVAIAIGDNWTRSKVFERLKSLAPNVEFPPSIHPLAYLARGATVGGGAIVGPTAVLGTDTRAGDFAGVSHNSSTGEDAWIGDFASLGPNAVMAGSTRLGAFSALGLGASVVQAVSIGEHTVIGASAAVVRDIGDHVVAVGVPARVIRERRSGDAYF